MAHRYTKIKKSDAVNAIRVERAQQAEAEDLFAFLEVRQMEILAANSPDDEDLQSEIDRAKARHAQHAQRARQMSALAGKAFKSRREVSAPGHSDLRALVEDRILVGEQALARFEEYRDNPEAYGVDPDEAAARCADIEAALQAADEWLNGKLSSV